MSEEGYVGANKLKSQLLTCRGEKEKERTLIDSSDKGVWCSLTILFFQIIITGLPFTKILL